MNFKRKRKKSLRIDLTPLVDVVFLLLIFYMLTSTFSKDEGVSLQLPEAQASAPLKSEKVLISILSDTRVEVQNVEIPVELLVEKLTEHVNDETDVVVRTAKDASVQTLVTVLDAVKGSGVKSVSLATVSPRK